MASLAFWRRDRTPPRPDTRAWGGFSTPPEWVIRNTYPSSYSVPQVDPESAISGTPAVYACVSLLAEVVGSLPLMLYKRKDDDERERVPYDGTQRGTPGVRFPGSLARLLSLIPNPEMTAQSLWETVVGHMALWGNAYVEVLRGADGRPRELWPLRPDRVRMARDKETSERVFFYQFENGSEVEVPEVLHIPWFGLTGGTGLSPITVARRTIAGENGAASFVADWYERGATPSAIVTIPRGPQEKFKERSSLYQEQMSAMYGGVKNAGRIAVIEDGVAWNQVSMSMEDMAYIETRKFTVTDLARVWRIPPHLVGDVEKSTSWGTGIQEQNLAFLAYTLRPILARIENTVCRDLGLVPGVKTLEDEKLYAEFHTADLLRADLETRYKAYAIGLDKQFLVPNEARRFENLTPLDGGDEVIVPQGASPPIAPVDAAPDEDMRAAILSIAQRPTSLGVTLPDQLQLDIPQPKVTTNVNLEPVARALHEAVGSLRDEMEHARESAALESQALRSEMDETRVAVLALADASKPVPMRRTVKRDEATGLIDLIVDEVV